MNLRKNDLIHGPWRSTPIIGGLYYQRGNAERRVQVVGPDEDDPETTLVRKISSGRKQRIPSADLIDEHRWHFLGTTAETPAFQ